MSTTLYVEQENGNLKLVAEVESIDNPALAVDALLDDAPRLKERAFVALSGSLDSGQVTRVTVDDDQPVNPRRSITVSSNGSGAEVAPPRRKRGRPRKDASESNGTTAPAKKRGGAAKKRGAAKKAAPAKGAAKRRGRPPKEAPANPVTGRVRTSSKTSGSARKASPFKTRPDDE